MATKIVVFVLAVANLALAATEVAEIGQDSGREVADAVQVVAS